MPLFWVVHERDGERLVWIQESHALIFARLNAMIDGFGGTFVEAHELDAPTARKIPRRVIGRTLSLKEAGALLDRLARPGTRPRRDRR